MPAINVRAAYQQDCRTFHDNSPNRILHKANIAYFTLFHLLLLFLFFFFQRRGDVGPSLVLRPSLRETTSGLPRSGCCCNTNSSWSSSGIKSVFTELSILFEWFVPPDTGRVATLVWRTFTRYTNKKYPELVTSFDLIEPP